MPSHTVPLKIDAPSTHSIHLTPYGEIYNPALTGVISLPSLSPLELVDRPSVSVSLTRIITISTKPSALRQIVRKKQQPPICYEEIVAYTKVIEPRQSSSTREDRTLFYDFALALPTSLSPTTRTAIATTSYVLTVQTKRGNGKILETTQDIRINRVLAVNATLVFEHFRKFERLPFTTKLFLSPQSLSDRFSESAIDATVFLNGPLIRRRRASEIKVTTIREVRWSVAEAIEVSSAQHPSAVAVHPEKRFMRTICEDKRKGNWRPEDLDSWEDEDGPSMRVQVPFHILVRNPNDNMEMVLPEPPVTRVAKEAARKRQLAISVSHRLRLEIVLGEDTFIQGTGSLVDRTPVRHCLGATYPLHIGPVVDDALIPEGAVEGSIELPGYEVSGEMPPSYRA